MTLRLGLHVSYEVLKNYTQQRGAEERPIRSTLHEMQLIAGHFTMKHNLFKKAPRDCHCQGDMAYKDPQYILLVTLNLSQECPFQDLIYLATYMKISGTYLYFALIILLHFILRGHMA